MIVYRGNALEAVAPVRVEDIRVSPIKFNPIVRPRALQFGAEFVRMNGGERTIAITFALLDDNPVTRHEYLQNINDWARTHAEARLELPIAPNHYLQCVCTSHPEPSTRVWWESKLRVVFTCFDNPYWTSKTEYSVACGTSMNILGTAPPLMRIECTRASAATDQAYSNGAQTMTFSSIPAGDMVIDLNKQTAAVGGVSTMNTYLSSGNFIIPVSGVQTITGNGTIKYRERWQ